METETLPIDDVDGAVNLDFGSDGAIEIDFSQVQGLEPIPAGKYTAQCVSCKSTKSKQGHPKFDWAWKVMDGEFAKRQVIDSLSFHPNALGRTKTILKNLGLNVDGKLRVAPGDIINKVATIRIDIETSTQKDPDTGEVYPPRNRIKSLHVTTGEAGLASLLE